MKLDAFPPLVFLQRLPGTAFRPLLPFCTQRSGPPQPGTPSSRGLSRALQCALKQLPPTALQVPFFLFCASLTAACCVFTLMGSLQRFQAPHPDDWLDVALLDIGGGIAAMGQLTYWQARLISLNWTTYERDVVNRPSWWEKYYYFRRGLELRNPFDRGVRANWAEFFAADSSVPQTSAMPPTDEPLTIVREDGTGSDKTAMTLLKREHPILENVRDAVVTAAALHSALATHGAQEDAALARASNRRRQLPRGRPLSWAATSLLIAVTSAGGANKKRKALLGGLY